MTSVTSRWAGDKNSNANGFPYELTKNNLDNYVVNMDIDDR
jgi:hypothetical protein